MSDASRLLAHADDLFRKSDYDEAEVAYREAAEAAEAADDATVLVEALAQVARCFSIRGLADEGRPWLARAAQRADPSDPRGWSRFLGVRGRFEWQDGDNPTARATFETMYAFCVEHGLHDRAIDAAHMVAIVAESPEDQIAWAKKGIREAEAGNIPRWLGPLWNNLAATYEESGDLDNALAAYDRAREYHHRYGTERNKLVADWAVGHAHRLLGHFEEAERWLKPVLAWCDRLDEREFLGRTLQELGEIALAQDDAAQGTALLSRALELFEALDMSSWDPTDFEALRQRVRDLSAAPPTS